MRKSPITRKTPLRSSGRPTPKKRSAAERTRIYGTDAHQAWLRAHACVGCASTGSDERPHHLHHVTNGGAGRKADASALVPLCPDCHAFYHQYGPSTFAAAFWRMLAGRTLREWAAHYARAWQRFQSEPEPVSSIVARVLPTLTGEDA
jgi:hypothetical protein